MAVMQFNVFSGGQVTFDLDVCTRCATKACVVACNAPNLACELACMTDGIGGITFSLPMADLDTYIADAPAHGQTPTFKRR